MDPFRPIREIKRSSTRKRKHQNLLKPLVPKELLRRPPAPKPNQLQLSQSAQAAPTLPHLNNQ